MKAFEIQPDAAMTFFNQSSKTTRMMNSLKNSLPLLLLAALGGTGLNSANAIVFSEPPLVVYGKVMHVGEGGAFQLFEGQLEFDLVRESDPTHVVPLTTPLIATGTEREFSYRLAIPQKYLPELEEREGSLIVAHQSEAYRIEAITVDGFPASPLDSTQITHLISSFALRAAEYRLDLKTQVPVADNDGDRMPDWWEDRHGLNRHSALDADQDPDGDGISNLKEFLEGTDPNEANFKALVQTRSLQIPASGTAGLYLTIIDQDTAPSDLELVFLEPIPGLTWYRGDEVLNAGERFTYQSVLAGDMTLRAAPDFDSASPLIFIFEDGEAGEAFHLEIKAYSPGSGTVHSPVIWLDASSHESQDSLAEWSDRSGHERDGYQPDSELRPGIEDPGSVQFNEENFMFVDEKELSLENSTTFMAFNPGRPTTLADQTLLGSSAVGIGIGGKSHPTSPGSLVVTQPGRTISGPILTADQTQRFTLRSGPERSFLQVADQGTYRSVPSQISHPSAFTTLGALRPFSEDSARNFFQGGIREVLVYRQVLEVGDRRRIEDYQQSRWTGTPVWDYSGATLPVRLTGRQTSRNVLSGGWGDDTLTGGPLPDLLRGGPNQDRLTGRGGGDRFQFALDDGNDTITDFSLKDRDILDLTALFEDRTGLPSQYVKILTQVTRGEGESDPRVDSVLELFHDGEDSDADQRITLEGVQIGDSDLGWLVGEGFIQLGGPRFETSIHLETEETEIIETEHPRAIKVVRTGNRDAAMRIVLNVSGTAAIDSDYRLEGTEGTGALRRVFLGRGEREATFHLVPVEDRELESESISMQVLSSPLLTAVPDTPLRFTLTDAAFISIQTIRHFQSGDDTPALVRIHRSGRINQTLEIPLHFGGTLVGGLNYPTLPESLTFGPGQTSRSLEIAPLAIEYNADRVDTLRIDLGENASLYGLKNPRGTSILVLPESAEPALSYTEWKTRQSPDEASLGAYLTGEPSAANASKIEIERLDGRVEIRFTTIAGLTDVALGISATDDFVQWQDVTHQFSHHPTWLEDGRLEHRYRLLKTETPQAFYRLEAKIIQPE